MKWWPEPPAVASPSAAGGQTGGEGRPEQRARVAVILPWTSSPWATADRALADALGQHAEVDLFGAGRGLGPPSTLAAASAIRAGYDALVVSVADHEGHADALAWLGQGDAGVARALLVVARDLSLVGLYRSLGPRCFARAWRDHYPGAPLPPTAIPEALMAQAAVRASDRYLVDSLEAARRLAIDLPPDLWGRVTVVEGGEGQRAQRILGLLDGASASVG